MAKPEPSRRKFMLTVGAGSAAAVAAVAVKAVPQAAQPKTLAQKPTRKGYELTEHVRNYYRTTLV